jgi:hypothetical protein
MGASAFIAEFIGQIKKRINDIFAHFHGLSNSGIAGQLKNESEMKHEMGRFGGFWYYKIRKGER